MPTTNPKSWEFYKTTAHPPHQKTEIFWIERYEAHVLRAVVFVGPWTMNYEHFIQL